MFLQWSWYATLFSTLNTIIYVFLPTRVDHWWIDRCSKVKDDGRLWKCPGRWILRVSTKAPTTPENAGLRVEPRSAYSGRDRRPRYVPFVRHADPHSTVSDARPGRGDEQTALLWRLWRWLWRWLWWLLLPSKKTKIVLNLVWKQF